MTKFEVLKNSSIGDQIIVKNPIFDEEVFILISKVDETLFFISKNSSTLIIKDQKTIDSFEVVSIDKNNSKWDSKLFTYVSEVNKIIDGNLKKFKGR